MVLCEITGELLMVLNKVFFNGFLLGLLLFVPVSGSTTNRQRFIINDFGTMNQINPSNTGNSTGLPNEFSGNDNYIVEDRSPVSSVPEPMTILLLGLGSLGLAAYRRRR